MFQFIQMFIRTIYVYSNVYFFFWRSALTVDSDVYSLDICVDIINSCAFVCSCSLSGDRWDFQVLIVGCQVPCERSHTQSSEAMQQADSYGLCNFHTPGHCVASGRVGKEDGNDNNRCYNYSLYTYLILCLCSAVMQCSTVTVLWNKENLFCYYQNEERSSVGTIIEKSKN